jgi:hypothetical protein
MKASKKIHLLTLENAKGEMVLFAEFTGNPACPYFGPTINYMWEVDGTKFSKPNPRNDYLRPLPDATGFLLCENLERNDNLVLLDAYGKERMRLSIPWQLTRDPHPEMTEYPSHFIGLTTPWDNPETGEVGKFAVLAWVQYAGDYAFELDWNTGQFKWGYFLERG